MRKLINTIILVISLALNAFGIMSLLYASGIYELEFLSFYSDVRLLLRYVFVVLIMAAGIMSFNLFATRCRGKVKNGLAIGVTTYSTILTIPLVLTFVLCLVQKCGVTFTGFINDFVGPIYDEFIDIFKTDVWQYLIFIGGILMSILFVVVPIKMCKDIVKPKEKKKSREHIRA